MEQTIRFEEGQPCPVSIEGEGGGLSFSPNGDMLLVGRFPEPSKAQVDSWQGKWRPKLCEESEFPSIPIFAVGNEDWILEAPCNPAQQEIESPGFCETLYAKDECVMVAVLVDSNTNIIVKIHHVPLDELFIERMVLSWNPYKGPADKYTQTFTNESFASRIQSIFKGKSPKQMWMTSW